MNKAIDQLRFDQDLSELLIEIENFLDDMPMEKAKRATEKAKRGRGLVELHSRLTKLVDGNDHMFSPEQREQMVKTAKRLLTEGFGLVPPGQT